LDWRDDPYAEGCQVWTFSDTRIDDYAVGAVIEAFIDTRDIEAAERASHPPVVDAEPRVDEPEAAAAGAGGLWGRTT
jgi:hypothetical protein